MGLDRNLIIKDEVVYWLYPDGSQHCLTQEDDSRLSYLIKLHTLVGELVTNRPVGGDGDGVIVHSETFYQLKRLHAGNAP